MKNTIIKLTQAVIFCLFISGLLFSCNAQPSQAEDAEAEVVEEIQIEEIKPNMLTQAEKDAGWELLFDGTTSEGWRGYKKDTFPSGWQVIDGTIQCNASGKAGGALEGGDIIFDSLIGDFRDVSVQWNTDASLGIFASGDVRFLNSVRTAGAGSVSVIAGWTGNEGDALILANNPKAAWDS